MEVSHREITRTHASFRFTALRRTRLDCLQCLEVPSLSAASAALGAGKEPGYALVPYPRSLKMGRLTSQIPNEDPARLARVQDAKWRTIGVTLHGTCLCFQLAASFSPRKSPGMPLVFSQRVPQLLKAASSCTQVDCNALQRQVGERQAKDAYDTQRDRCS